MPLDSNIRLALAAKLTAPLKFGTAYAPTSFESPLALATGIAAGQADKIFSDTRTLAASATEDLDLAGVLLDSLGAVITFAKVKALVIRAAATNVNNVIVGGAATNGFASWVGAAAHTVVVRPGATLALFAGVGDANGYAVTPATGDLLRVGNSAAVTSVTYDVIVIGTSA